MRLLPALLLTFAATAFAQDEGVDVAAELAQIVALPTPQARASAAAVLARKPGVGVDSVLAAIRAPRAYPAAAAGAASERVSLVFDGAATPVQVHTYVPEGYDPATPAPLLLALHGTGGSGAEMIGMWQATADAVGMVVVAPDDHGENAGYRFSPEERDAALAALRWARLRFHVDADRIHCTGVSRGGHLTWDLALRHPDLFASISPMIGGPRLSFTNGQNNTRYVQNVAHVPIRDLQGAQDDPRLLANLRFVFERLEALGAEDARLIEFEGLGHSFDLGAVDWAALFGATRRAARPDRVVRAAARSDETRAFFVDITKLGKGISERFAPRVDPKRWATLDEDAQRREVLRQVEEATAVLDVRRIGPLTYEARGDGVDRWRLLLAAEDLPEDDAVVVRWNGRTVKRRAKPDVLLLITDWVERLDPGFLPVAEITL